MSQKTSFKLNTALYERARLIAGKSGYSSTEEFIEHAIEKQLSILEDGEPKDEVLNKLKGLGYLE